MSRLVCQVLDCGADLSRLKEYHQRYRICETHLKASTVERDGEKQRFCQQCGRFHSLGEFDSDKRSCRSRLERHNQRRRKRSEHPGEEAVDLQEEQPEHYATDDKLRFSVPLSGPPEFAPVLPPSFPHFSDFPALSHRVQSELHTRRLLQAALDSRAHRADVFNQSMFAAGVAAESAAHSLGSASRMNEIISPSSRRISPKVDPRARHIHESESPVTNERLLERTSSGGSMPRQPKMQRRGSELESIHHFLPPDVGYGAPRELQRVFRLSVKLLNRPIQEIPSQLREQFASWLAFAPTSLEAFVRPGCIQITADIRCTEAEFDEMRRNGYDRIQRWVKSRKHTCSFWGKDVHAVFQIADGPALEVTTGGEWHLFPAELPELVMGQPHVFCSSAQQSVRLQGVGLVPVIQSGAKIHCRGYSGYFECDVVAMTAAEEQKSSEVYDEILVALPSAERLSSGVAWLEISKGKCLGNAVPLFVTQSNELATELLQLCPYPLCHEDGAEGSATYKILLGIGFAVGLSCWGHKNPVAICKNEVEYLLQIGYICIQKHLKCSARFVWDVLFKWSANLREARTAWGMQATMGDSCATIQNSWYQMHHAVRRVKAVAGMRRLPAPRTILRGGYLLPTHRDSDIGISHSHLMYCHVN